MSPTFTLRWRCLAVSALLMVPLSAYPQTTLTGAIQFATDSTGAFSLNQSWNTLGGDLCWDLWLAQNPDASSPGQRPIRCAGRHQHTAGSGQQLSVLHLRRTFFFFQAEDGIRDYKVTGVQTCALPIWILRSRWPFLAWHYLRWPRAKL